MIRRALDRRLHRYIVLVPLLFGFSCPQSSVEVGYATSAPATREAPVLELREATDPRYKQADPDATHYTLGMRGEQTVILSVKNEEITSIHIFDSKARRSILFSKQSQTFTDCMSFSMIDARGELGDTLYDQDRDGVPETLMKAPSNKLYDLVEPRWKLRGPSPATRPVALEQSREAVASLTPRP